MPSTKKKRVASGVTWNEKRQRYELRFMATVYEDQVLGQPKPPQRKLVWSKDVRRAARIPDDFDAAVEESRALRRSIEQKKLAELRGLAKLKQRPVSFGELADAYEVDAKDRKTRWDKERYRWAVLVEEIGRDTAAENITADWLLEWRRNLRARRSLSGRSVNAYVTLLRSIFRHGLRAGRVKADPTAHLRPYPENQGEVEWLTPEQFAAVLTAARVLQDSWAGAKRYKKDTRQTPVYDLVVALYTTAARTVNVLSLEWDRHVDWSEECIVWLPGETKNRRRVVVPFTDRLRDVLESRRQESGWVFPSSTGEGHISNQALRLAWRDVVAKANEDLDPEHRIDPGFVVYNLRHTRATHLLSTTGNLKAVADLLGDTVAMVEKRYAGRNVPGLRQAMAAAAVDPMIGQIDGCSKTCSKTAPKTAENGCDPTATDEEPKRVN